MIQLGQLRLLVQEALDYYAADMNRLIQKAFNLAGGGYLSGNLYECANDSSPIIKRLVDIRVKLIDLPADAAEVPAAPDQIWPLFEYCYNTPEEILYSGSSTEKFSPRLKSILEDALEIHTMQAVEAVGTQKALDYLRDIERREREANMLAAETEKVILQCPKHAMGIVEALDYLRDCLQRVPVFYLTFYQKMRDYILRCPRHAMNIAQVFLRYLAIDGPLDMYDDRNLEAIFKHPQYAEGIVKAFDDLKHRKPDMLTLDVREAILQCPERAMDIVKALIILKAGDITLASGDLVGFLQHPEDPIDRAMALRAGDTRAAAAAELAAVDVDVDVDVDAASSTFVCRR